MKNKGCTRWGLWLAAGLVLVALCVVAGGLVYFQARARAFNNRPLVLIHSPVNHEQARVGDGIIVHATARADNGLRRLELWVGNTFVDARDVTEGSAPTMLVFSGSWVPNAAGNHALIVRAIAADGTEGQASVVVETHAQAGSDSGTHIVEAGETIESIAESYGTTPEELAASNPGLDPGAPAPGEELVIPDAADSGTHIVEAGETLETIAEEHGTTPEELAAANPDLDPSGPAPGDELTIPDDEPPPAEDSDPPVPEDSEPPIPDVDPPDDLRPRWRFPEFPRPDDGEPTGLRVEFINLGTVTALEGLHCYIGAGSATPRWYPDQDGDQTTDESFALDGTGLGEPLMWSLESLSGDSAPVFFWPRNRDLPVSVSCVGITGGGTEALELGHWEDSISPVYWTGVPFTRDAVGADGAFVFTFRITRLGGGGVPIFLDPDMTPPTNVRLYDRPNYLGWDSMRWDYEPRPDEEAIDGFRIYLNGSLQWVEPADARESGLPYEWFNPPCGTTYTFAVTAYRFGLPDGPESYPDVAILEQPAEDCTREVLITFLTLETFDLGGDGDSGDRIGDIGPVNGHFYANERFITFDGGDLGDELYPNGLWHDTTYNLVGMSADPAWHFSGMPALLVAIPDGGTFAFGFNIMDEDSGNPDDPICEGFVGNYHSDSYELNEHNEGAIMSEDGRCRVTYQWGPAAGSPVGPGVEGQEPLPWIDLENFVVNEDTGQVQLHVRNTGTATWPWRDLSVELQSRGGVSLGVYTWTAFVLEPGQRTVLEHPDMRLSAPFDACVLIDPYDDVLEAWERSGALFHNPICPQIPDLVISDVRYEPIGGNGQLLLTLQNVGEGALENRVVSFQTYLPDGTPLYIGGSRPNITLGRFETITFGVGGVSESVREQMQAGYSVVVNPDRSIFESNVENNTFSVAPYQLRMAWCDACIPHYSGAGSTARMFLTADILNGSGVSRTVFEPSRSSTLTSTDTLLHEYREPYHCWEQGGRGGTFSCNEAISETFAILGDESLRVSIHADFLAGSSGDREYLGTTAKIYTVEDYSLFPFVEGTILNSYNGYCPHYEVWPDSDDVSWVSWWRTDYPPSWNSYFCIARIAP